MISYMNNYIYKQDTIITQQPMLYNLKTVHASPFSLSKTFITNDIKYTEFTQENKITTKTFQ
jgi:uracil DNA glycosylase